MTLLTREFEKLIKEYRCRNGSTVFRRAGLEPSVLSRMRNNGINLQFDQIHQLANAISPEEMVYLRLKRARLLDECLSERDKRLNIKITGGWDNRK